MKTHTLIGARLLSKSKSKILELAREIALNHHERFDGSGYPNGLRGETISLGARIIAVCDTFDAMVSDRPYRQGMPKEKVIETIRQGAGKEFDPNVVEAFLQIID
jgi:putative two-component system response regulator